MNEDKTSNRKSNVSLSKFKKSIDNILKQINNFNQDDKNAAFNYVKQHFFVDNFPVSSKRQKNLKLNNRVFKIRKKKLNSSFKCKICEDVASTKIQFLKHMEKHIQTPITCKKCRKSFNNRTSFDWHLSNLCRNTRKVLTKKYKCLQCPKEFLLQTHLFLHQVGHKRNNCSHCGAVFTKRINLVQHLFNNHNVKQERSRFNCDQCSKSFIKRRSLFYHLKNHYEFVCIDCGCISKTTHEHDNHVITHKGKKPWQCLKCGDQFSRRQLYFNHLIRHDRYKCLTCKENFASQFHALKHRKIGHVVHGLEPRLHCPYCPSSFFRSLLLKTHLHKHRDEEATLHCKFCKMSFQTPRQYFKHCLTTTHDKKSPENEIFVCEHCGKQFTKKHVFEKHLHRFHEQQIGSYSCSHCEYKTKFGPNLSRHLKLHFTKENQFMCDHCGKYFSNEAVLGDHINYIHKEVKQLNCAKCDKSFKRRSELTRHLSTHSDLRPYCCEMCSNTYKRVAHLRRHEENAHGVSKKSKRVKRFVTDSSGLVVPVPEESKKGKQSSNVTASISDPVSTVMTDKLYLQVINKLPFVFTQAETNLGFINIGEHNVTSIVPVQKDEVGCRAVDTSNEVLSIIVKASETSHSTL